MKEKSWNWEVDKDAVGRGLEGQKSRQNPLNHFVCRCVEYVCASHVYGALVNVFVFQRVWYGVITRHLSRTQPSHPFSG